MSQEQPQLYKNQHGTFALVGDRVLKIPERHALNIKIAAENAQHAIDNITRGYRKLGEHHTGTDDCNDKREAIVKSRHARYRHPFVVAGSRALLRWSFSKPFSWSGVTNDDRLSDLINNMISVPISDAWDVIDNAECELQDGSIITAVRLSDDRKDVSVNKMDTLEFDVYGNVNSVFSQKETWLHKRTYTLDDKEVTTYYPDISFWPNRHLVDQLVKEIKKKSPAKIWIDWSIRICRHDFNGGWPLIAAAIDYAICLNSIIELQTAVLTSIASAATNFVTDDVEEIAQARDGFERIRHDNEHGEFESHTVIGSGRLQAVNLNVAMLTQNSALYKLLHAMIYNSFSDLRPQDFAESEAGGLGGDTNRNQKQVVGAGMRQNEWSQYYKRLLSGIFAWLEVAGTDVPSITIRPKTYTVGTVGETITSYSVVYDENLTIIWPKIDKGDQASAINSIVKAFTAGRLINVGTPQEFANAVSVHDIEMSVDKRTEGVESLIELGDTLADFIGEFQEIEI